MLQSFITVGQQIITLYLLLAVGFLIGKVKLIDEVGSTSLSSLVMYVVTPCMTLVAYQRPLEHDSLHGFLIVAAVSLVLHLLFIAASMLIRSEDKHRQGALRFATIFTNCGYMGYPLMTALLGSIGVFYGTAYVLVFTLLSWTVGVYIHTGDRNRLKLKPLILNPGVIGTVVAMALYLMQITIPEILMVPVRYIADLNTPLPMIVVGCQLSRADFRKALRDTTSWLAMGLRLVALPLLSLAVCLLFHVPHDLSLVLVIAASAPPAALLSMFAAKFGGDTALTSSMVSVQTAFSALTMPIMVGLAQYLC